MYERVIEEEVPNGFECPLSLEVMKEPVIASDGHSYEREEIERYFGLGRLISPITRAPFANQNLIPNLALKKAIADWREGERRRGRALAEALAREEGLRRELEQMKRAQQARASVPVVAPLPQPAPAPVLAAAAGAAVAEPKVGEFTQGGVVFYVDRENRRALVCAIRDVGRLRKWGPLNTNTNIKAQELFSGGENTRRLAGLGGQYEAAQSASQCNEGGYWYLPSYNELQQMYAQRQLINAEALKRGGSALIEKKTQNYNHIYWSSSECNRHYAYSVNFFNGYMDYDYKNYSLSVRSVRAFTFC